MELGDGRLQRVDLGACLVQQALRLHGAGALLVDLRREGCYRVLRSLVLIAQGLQLVLETVGLGSQLGLNVGGRRRQLALASVELGTKLGGRRLELGQPSRSLRLLVGIFGACRTFAPVGELLRQVP